MPTERELIEKVSQKVAKMNAYCGRLKIADQMNLNQIGDLVDLVNNVLRKHGVSDKIGASHIRFNADYIGNISFVDDKKLSNLIFERIYPTPTRQTYSHYTTLANAVSIIDRSEFWLFNLLRNYDADEFRLFYRDHGLDGYEEDSETFGIWTGYRQLMSEIFVLSMTTEENTSDKLWEYFADNGTGVKMTFEIESKIPDFREVYYSTVASPEPIGLLRDLFTEIKDQFHYPFNFSCMSKIGAFYIRGSFSNEQEYRFLIKRTSDTYDGWRLQPITYQNDVTYVVLPFESEYANIKLIKVERGPMCAAAAFDEQIVPLVSSRHRDVEIIK